MEQACARHAGLPSECALFTAIDEYRRLFTREPRRRGILERSTGKLAG